MADDAGTGTATGSAGADAQPQGQDTGAGAPAGDGQGGTGAPSATPGIDDRSAEDLLAGAITSGDGDGQDTTGKDDPLKAAQTELARWKEQARRQERRAKENAEKAKNFDAYQESQKTEAQKQADALAAALEEAKTEREERLRLLAAASYDLPPSMINHLGGGTEEEINARAEGLAAAINERAAVMAAAQVQANGQQPPRNGGGFRPVESLRPGGLPASDNKPRDPNEWFRGLLASKKQ